MPTQGGLTLARTWTSVSASEAAPTTSTTFVTPEFFPGADSLEVSFDSITKDASATQGTVELWYKGYDSEGTEQVIPYDATVASFSASSTSDTMDRVQYTNVPAGSWYLRLMVTAGTTPTVTTKGFLRYYKS